VLWCAIGQRAVQLRLPDLTDTAHLILDEGALTRRLILGRPPFEPSRLERLPQTRPAIAFAERRYAGQSRSNGTPFILHPLDLLTRGSSELRDEFRSLVSELREPALAGSL
jgi:hypothetical protein